MKMIFALLVLILSDACFANFHKKHHECRHKGEGKLHRIKQRKPVKLHHLHSTHPFENPRKKIAPLPNYKVDFKFLILSATGNPDIEPSLSEAKKALQSVGMPYSIMVLTQNGARLSTAPLQLINADGSGKFFGIITTTGELAFETNSGDWDSALTPNQWEDLKNYEAQFSVRRVSLYTYPNDLVGAEAIPGRENGNPNYLIFTSIATPHASGYQLSAKPPIKDTWLYPARITNSALAKSFMLFKDSTVASVTDKFSDGREQLHFFFDQSVYIQGSVIIAPIWIKWLSRNAYIGKRRLYLEPHVDDLYLSTGLWDPATQTIPEDGSRIYRAKNNDIQSLIDFQNNYLRPTSSNSNFRIEMAYNGEGIIDYGGYNSDQLFLKTKAVATQFNWLTHTWDHADMTNLTYQEATLELTKNYVPAQNLGVWGTNYFSSNSIITPGISGLFNGNVLKAFFDQNITTVVGDNSRSELVNQENPYIGLFTTQADNGFAGIFILPRNATEVYFNVSTKAELISEYNFFYRDYFGYDSTFNQIMIREEELALARIFNFEPAPTMFHQANLRRFLVNNAYESLLSLWIRQVVNGIRKYSTLPIVNYKMNDLRQIYFTRQAFERCGLNAQFEAINFKLSKIYASSTAACVVPITGVSSSGIPSETYGPDNTLLLSLDGVSGKVITLNTPIAVQ